MPDETTIYYVFSTIAQTLAGAVGILAAFAVMRLSSLSERLRDKLPSLAEYARYPEAFYACLDDGNFEGTIIQVDEERIGGSHDILTLNVCQRAERQRKELVWALQLSLLLTGLVITASVVTMMFANRLRDGGASTWIVLSLGFLGLLSCLVVMGLLVLRLAPDHRRNKRKKRKATVNRRVAA